MPPLPARPHLAICLLRRAASGWPPCPRGIDGETGWRGADELREAAEALVGFVAARRSARWDLQLGCCGSVPVTRNERRLLRALVAAQAGDEAVVDNHLFRLALDRQLRADLAVHVREFAAMLAVYGHWLAPPGAPLSAAGSRAATRPPDR